MTTSSAVRRASPNDRYAENMKSDMGCWESSQQHSHPHWAYSSREVPIPAHTFAMAAPRLAEVPEPQGHVRLPKTRTSPVVTRTRIARYGSQPSSQRPLSSGAEQQAMMPYTQFAPPRRSESYSHPTPLEDFRKSRRWPPAGFRRDDSLTAKDAELLICPGASTFKGFSDAIEHAPPGYVRYYAVMDTEAQGRTDRAPFRHPSYKDISLNITGATESHFPWLSLEQPCMSYAFGKSAGTTTLNYWVGKFGSGNPPTKFVGSAKPRKLKLLQILDRLRQLENGLDDDVDEQYRYLYSTLIEDPDRFSDKPHFGTEQQIADLITVLTHPSWIDFSNPKNQVVAKFFDSPDQHKKQEFLHQLLLSVELHLRIHSNHHSDKAKKKLIMQLPPLIAWDLAVAQRWLENMTITKTRISHSQSTFDFELRSKNRQIQALRVFAETLKWPNMDEVEYVLDQKDKKEKPLEDRSRDTMSWFSGIILPGRTLPWLIMNSLVDCDRDTGDALRHLTHMHQSSGFQYRANTYWSYRCIVGKVLGAARGVKQVAGWIGPCIYCPELHRTECVRIRQKEALDPKLTPRDVTSMDVRSHPLGPQEESYPVDDYEVPMPDMEDVTDAIRIEKLTLVPPKDQPDPRGRAGTPILFDAAISFACGGKSWPMKLKYDVDFVQAFPCYQGPHVLFYDFTYRAIKIDNGLVDIKDWGRECGRISRPVSARSSPSKASTALTTTVTADAHTQVQKVLAIEALGVSDNEVFARAWCAHHGHSAIVANIKETCMACAIREAYAACISVVIFTEGGKEEEEDKGVFDGFDDRLSLV